MACKRCGECCKGTPKVDIEEIKKIERLGLRREEFIELLNGIPYIKTVDGGCVFLGQEKSGIHYCKIYDARPTICRLYPSEYKEDCRPEKLAFDDYLEERNRERWNRELG